MTFGDTSCLSYGILNVEYISLSLYNEMMQKCKDFPCTDSDMPAEPVCGGLLRLLNAETGAFSREGMKKDALARKRRAFPKKTKKWPKPLIRKEEGILLLRKRAFFTISQG